MKQNTKVNRILECIRTYAGHWQMRDGTTVEQHKWLIEYTEKQADASIKTIEYLDSKADGMMRYIGILVTLSSAALLYAINKDQPRILTLSFFPVLLALLFSFWNALRCTRPADHPRRPFIKQAFTHAQYPLGNNVYFLRDYIELEYRLWLLAFYKGTYIEASFWGLLLATIWLLVGSLVNFFQSSVVVITDTISFPLEYLIVGAGLLSVCCLAVYRIYKAGQVPLADWERLFPETSEQIVPTSAESLD